MKFNLIDLTTWKRSAYYQHYTDNARCTYSIIVNIEIDSLVKKIKSFGIKTYPVQIYMLAKVVNEFQEFKMTINSQGSPGYWDTTNPSYAIFNRKTETFSNIYTLFNLDFMQFYNNCTNDIQSYRDSDVLFPQNDMPENVFTISSFPWQSFTGFNLNFYGKGMYLPPIFTIGRYLEQDGKKHMPLAIQVHHAVCDGYHVGKFVESLQELVINFNDWL